jgi:CHAT domain-containing protein/tetratricopeptide (TPR) repeat protein
MIASPWLLRTHPGWWGLLQHVKGNFALLAGIVRGSLKGDGELDSAVTSSLATQLQAAEAMEAEAARIQNPKQQKVALRVASLAYSNAATVIAYLPEDCLSSINQNQLEKTVTYAERAVELYRAGMERPRRRGGWLAQLGHATPQAHLALLHCNLAALYLTFKVGDPTIALEKTIREYTSALKLLAGSTMSEFTGYVLTQLGSVYLAYPTENPEKYAAQATETFLRAHEILEIHAAKIRAMAELSYSESERALIVKMVKMFPLLLSLMWKPYWRGTPGKVLGVMMMPPSVLMKIHWGLAAAYGELGDDEAAIRHYELASEFIPLHYGETELGMLLLAQSAVYLDAADKGPWNQAAVNLALENMKAACEDWDGDLAWVLGYPRLARTFLTSPRAVDLAPERERYLKSIVSSLRDAVQTARRLDLQGAARNALVVLGRAYEALADWPSAFRAIVLAGRIAKRSATLARTPRLKLRLSLEEGELLELGARAIFTYRRLLAETGRRIPRHLDSHALDTAERARTRILQDELAQRALLPKGGRAEELQDFFKLRRRWLQSDLLYINLETCETAQPPERMELVRAQRNAAEVRYLRELEAIRERFGDPDYDPDCPVAPVRSSEIRTLVRELSASEETALVEFFLTDRNLVVFIVFPSGQDSEDLICRETSLTRNELNDIARDWFEGLEKLNDETMNVAQWETRHFSQTLQRLEGPLLVIRDAIATWETNTQRRIRRLILVPHQFLHLLPLHALLLPDGDYWGCRFAIQYAPSASVMWQLHQARIRSEDAPTRTAAEHAKIVVAYSPPKSKEGKQEPLYFARHEAEAVGRALDANVIAGDNATPPRVLTAISHAHFIHFACHVSFEVEAPMESSLTLAPPSAGNQQGENEQSGESGFLTLAHLLEHLHFSESPIVVLSACESGIPKIERYRDEYLGLPLAFLCAGAKTVVSTLWKTSDLAAWILMGAMAEHLGKGCDVLQALDLAREEMQSLTRDDIRARVERLVEEDPEVHRKMKGEIEQISDASACSYPLASPYWWAGFAVHGLADAGIA